MRRLLLIPIALALLVACLPGQVLLDSGTYAYSGAYSGKNVVRDSLGTLWALSITDTPSGDHPTLLQYSTDNGATWIVDPFMFNDASSGMTGTPYASQVSVAIDDFDTLHVVWGVYAYPSPYTQYYRQYNPYTTTSSAIVNLTSTMGSNSSVRTTALCVAQDATGTIWITRQGSSSWIEALAKSNLPYASDLTFTSLGNISTSASSQSTRMAIDSNGLVHLTYYRNVGAGEYYHRYYDPLAPGWGPETRLGNTAVPNDTFGDVCADSLGNVHCVYAMDISGSSAIPKLRYRKWDIVNGWGPEVIISDIPNANWNGIANDRILCCACDEATGTVRVTFRDLTNGGSLEVSELPLGGSIFAPVATLGGPNMGAHAFYSPTMRGTLYPASNNCAGNYDITWQFRPTPGAPPYEFWFQRLATGANVSISLTGPPAIGTAVGILMTSTADGGKPYVCALSFSDTPGIVLPDTRVIPLNWDFLFDLTLNPNPLLINNMGVLDGSGNGQATLFIPYEPLIINFTIYSAFVTVDGGAPSGIANISQALPITFQ